jgi:hypothetical protein
MTSIHVDDPREAAKLPPLPMEDLANGTAGLLQQAAGLPQPACIFIYRTQHVSIQFAREQASAQAVSRWAHRFGSTMTSEPCQGTDGPETWHRTEFSYCGIAVTAYAHVPAAPASN